ncbi:hypothetical protein KY321_04355 [Candidatus Woesearchaeota archaeon]|nr:hypothetical protein [Candidatus Woesearchaeota archaeon]
MTNKYWFRKRKGIFTKDMGYGWVPISKEGVICVVLYVLGILYIAYDLTGLKGNVAREDLFEFFASMILLLAVFIFIAAKKTKPEVNT